MAETGYVVQARVRPTLHMIEKIVQLVLDGTGAGTTVVNLDQAFLTAPTLVCVPPLGAAGTYKALYDSATPKITVSTVNATVSGAALETVAGLQSKTVEVILYGIEQP